MNEPYPSGNLWLDTLAEGDDLTRRTLEGPLEVDVAVVGGGYTGLWSAYYLSTLAPELRTAVIEAEFVGFGASGRNGGWASAEFSMHREATAARLGRAAVAAQLAAVAASIDEIGRVVEEEAIDCGFAKGGTLTFATNPAHVSRLRAEIEEQHAWGFDESDYRWLDAAEARGRANVNGTLGAVYTPHCAAVHPARLVRGLACAVERRGVSVYEGTRVTAIEPGRVLTDRGPVLAEYVLRCTEAFSVGLPGHAREVVPVFSLMVGTEPLPESTWSEVGLKARQTFSDGRHLVIYGQRTADDRFAFGGRGAPYHYGSGIGPRFDRHPGTHRNVEAVLKALFPQILDAEVTHRWGGAVAIPRDWTSSVRFDPRTRVGSAGGYVGAGVTPSNLAGRTLADLVLGRETDEVQLPWVGHVSRQWEPEPLRWVGINAARILAPAADSMETRTGRPSRVLGGTLHRLTGH